MYTITFRKVTFVPMTEGFDDQLDIVFRNRAITTRWQQVEDTIEEAKYLEFKGYFVSGDAEEALIESEITAQIITEVFSLAKQQRGFALRLMNIMDRLSWQDDEAWINAGPTTQSALVPSSPFTAPSWLL